MNLNCIFIIMSNKKILYNSIIVAVLISFCIYSQDCDDGFTYYDTLPGNVNNINNDIYCFYNEDLTVLDNFISINDLTDAYNFPLEPFDVGLQTWVTGRLVILVATYIGGGSNGLTQKINQLPENIGQLSELTTLYLEKHDLTELPESFTFLSNLANLYISNNWLISLPANFGNLTNLMMLDLGYNQIASIPESIGNLESLEYLFLFNNQLASLPETICNLNLDWDGISPANYPYFACGGNFLCNPELIPDCVENSANFEISMEQNYYSFLQDDPQDCEDECPNLGDLNGDGEYNVLDIVNLANCVLEQNCADLENGCVGDLNSDGEYNVLDIVSLVNLILS